MVQHFPVNGMVQLDSLLVIMIIKLKIVGGLRYTICICKDRHIDFTIELSESYNSNPTSSNPSVDLALYFMEPNAINFNEVNTNFRTYYDDTVLGFPAKWMLAIQWDMILSDGRGSYTRFEATGEENWSQGNLITRDARN